MDSIAPFIRSAWNYDRDIASEDASLLCPPEEGMTQQQFAEEVDINTIVRRFGLTGQLPVNPRPPIAEEFEGVFDFQSAMNAVRRAEEGFMEFPADLRSRFNHDPQRMLEFLSDEGNREEAIRLGLVPKAPEVTRDIVPKDDAA